jgi:hypothetical protein
METKKSSSVNFIFKRIKPRRNLNLTRYANNKNLSRESSSSSLLLTEHAVNDEIKLNSNDNQNNYVFKSDKESFENENHKTDSIEEKNNRGIPKYLTPITSKSYDNCVNFQISRINQQLIAYPLCSSICLRSDFDESLIKKENQNTINSDLKKSIVENSKTNEAQNTTLNENQSEKLNSNSEFNHWEKISEPSNCFIDYSCFESKTSSFAELEKLKPLLVKAINEIILYKPDDPIEFLANFLHNFNSK